MIDEDKIERLADNLVRKFGDEALRLTRGVEWVSEYPEIAGAMREAVERRLQRDTTETPTRRSAH